MDTTHFDPPQSNVIAVNAESAIVQCVSEEAVVRFCERIELIIGYPTKLNLHCTLTDFRHLNDSRILHKFHEQRIIAINLNGAIVAATNNFILSITIRVDQRQTIHIAIGDNPQFLIPINIVAANKFCEFIENDETTIS